MKRTRTVEYNSCDLCEKDSDCICYICKKTLCSTHSTTYEKPVEEIKVPLCLECLMSQPTGLASLQSRYEAEIDDVNYRFGVRLNNYIKEWKATKGGKS